MKQELVTSCPHCGESKTVLSLHAFMAHGTQWSDGAYNTAMLPSSLYLRQCPICHRYFFYKFNANIPNYISYSQTGELPYRNLKEAFEQLQPKGEEEILMRKILVWAYNDHSENPMYSSFVKQEREYFLNNVKALLQLHIEPIFRAELLREIEQFDECIAVLDTIEDKKSENIKNVLLQKAKEKDSKVFRVCGDAIRQPAYDWNTPKNNLNYYIIIPYIIIIIIPCIIIFLLLMFIAYYYI